MADTPDQQPDPVEKSLGDQATGADVSRVDRNMSLGDQSTTGDAHSSLSDLGSDLGEAIDADLPMIDLAARYEIEGELGQGGMGAVLLATDRQLKRKVAIKRILGSMSKSKTALQRFVTEAQSIAALNHFNIVQVYEFGRDSEGPFLVLEYVGGGSLLDKLKDGKLEVEEAVDITCQLCDGLSLAHDQGVVHRDIKPANILLTERGEPKLTDFGLARQNTADDGQTLAGAVLGTIDFMPPEQRRDATATDARSDLWSLAATCYQMITGEVPRVIDLDAVPQNLRSTFARALKQNPEERYATAEEFKTELRKGMGTAATPMAADLAAGVCPACSTANDASRKFCRGCGDSLRVQCLGCEEDIPVWEDICGECGSKQQELRDLVRNELTTALAESLALAQAHKYQKALVQLNTVGEDQHAFTKDLRDQAEKQLDEITAQRNEQYQLRDQLVELAWQHQQVHDYAAAVRELETIPAPLRTEPVREEGGSDVPNDAMLTLSQRVGAQLTTYYQLADDVPEDLENIKLSTKQRKVMKLAAEKQQPIQAQQLAEEAGCTEIPLKALEKKGLLVTSRQRPNPIADQLSKLVVSRDELASLLQEITQAIKEKSYQGLLENTTRYLQLKPNDKKMEGLLEKLQARQRTQRIESLKDQIHAAVKAKNYFGVLKDVQEYLELVPDDEEMTKLKARLIEFEKKVDAQFDTLLEKALRFIKHADFPSAGNVLERIPAEMRPVKVKDMLKDVSVFSDNRSASLEKMTRAVKRFDFAAAVSASESYNRLLSSRDITDVEFTGYYNEVHLQLSNEKKVADYSNSRPMRQIFKTFFTWQGRMGRGLYWMSMMWLFLPLSANLGLAIEGPEALFLEDLSPISFRVFQVLLATISIYALICVHIKRYHDLGKPGKYSLLSLIGFGVFSFIECGFKAGEKGPNQYGLPQHFSPASPTNEATTK
jgi:serine/threonine protein kinase/uncharacterized membrane protein YhaH (DUF805 family)